MVQPSGIPDSPEVHVELIPVAQVKVPVEEHPLSQLVVAPVAAMFVAKHLTEESAEHPENME